jgi:hypothetical protein
MTVPGRAHAHPRKWCCVGRWVSTHLCASVPDNSGRRQNRYHDTAVPPPMDRTPAVPARRPSTSGFARTVRLRNGWITAGGITALAVPGGSGLAWLLAGRPDAWPVLAAALASVIAVVLNSLAAMYQARQETRRKEIEQHSADIIAASLARVIDDTHARTQGLPAAQEADEAALVRASAAQIMAEISPAILAALGHRHPTASDQDHASP